jgi:hypothetical protein
MQKYKTLEEFFNGLSEDNKVLVAALRDLILKTAPQLDEHIKWNAPSYVLDGEDRITFNLMNKQNAVKLVFHMGATRKENKKGEPIMQDKSGLIEWNSDSRGTVTFTSLADIDAHSTSLEKIIKDWLSIPLAN